jgi:uncharacterized membrane protein YqiK
MALLTLLVAVTLAALLLALTTRAPGGLKALCVVGAIVVLLAGALLSSVRFVAADEVGIIKKNALGGQLKDGRIIATDGEMGIQADVLPPGWHFGYWPFIYDVKAVELVEIRADEVGLIEAVDGAPLESEQLFAPEFAPAEFQQMLDARYFLTTGNGRKGTQASVLTPGKYRINTELFKITAVPQTEVPAGSVAVLRTNYGKLPQGAKAGDDLSSRLVAEGEMGVQSKPLAPGKYPINPRAVTVTIISTADTVVQYTATVTAADLGRDTTIDRLAGGAALTRNVGRPASAGQGRAPAMETNQITNMSQTFNQIPSDAMVTNEEREITVRTADGFTFPVDVRVEYRIQPANAPKVVSRLRDDRTALRRKLDSVVRAAFRNAAEKVRALDYVQQRSQQEEQSLRSIASEMKEVGIDITAVRIGNVGDQESLGTLLKTQTDRELAKQEQLTFQEQQRAAEQKKQLTKSQQEAEEERKLATAAYQVKIAEEDKKKQLIAAQAEAETIRIKAEAQSKAYQLVAGQIGKANAALIEVLKIVGERNIQITPRVMVTGGGGGGGSAGAGFTGAEGAALVGTMLDSMISRAPEDERRSPVPAPGGAGGQGPTGP